MYCFKPLLDKSDVDLVCGTITSNRYLTMNEKEYLIAREKTLCYGDKYIQDQNPLPEKPRNAQKQLSEQVLKIANTLYDAIRRKYQVDITYGFYGEDPKRNHHPVLLAKNENKPYHLNPYAMLWNDGEYYLLATHRGHTNISHFRIDRIVAVRFAASEDDATKNRKREPIPDSLKPFFKRAHGREEFQAERYTAMYPLMAIFGEADLCEAVVECKANAIGVVIDYFGMNLRIMPPTLEHPSNELDLNGRSQSYVSIKLPKAQYENLRGFCLLQHSIVTVVSPDRLIRDVREGLIASADKLPENTN
ncbi:MAG: WYL domain-containing protein [Lachnospiraceae bacterium]|nr:WYL domain-containing protein [Lachnospiraceae bacterium]